MPNWKEILEQVQSIKAQAAVASQQNLAAAQQAFDLVRRKYLGDLFRHTGRNVIAYYSGFLSKPDIPYGLDINDEDKNGFMMAVHKLDRTLGLDLILHTPGGDIAATESLVDYLRRMFGKNIRAIVPQIAMSAGTMVACSCKKILLAKHSNLGPIDPHLGGRPAYGVLSEFRRALKEIRKDPSYLDVWRPILAQYPPTYLSRCENAIKWSNQFVRDQLEKVMFDGIPNAKLKARAVVKKLADYRGNRTHARTYP
jgi:ClpP class serine protease